MQLTILDVKGVKYMDYALIRDYEILDVKGVKYMDYALIRGSTKKQLTIISKSQIIVHHVFNQTLNGLFENYDLESQCC